MASSPSRLLQPRLVIAMSVAVTIFTLYSVYFPHQTRVEGVVSPPSGIRIPYQGGSPLWDLGPLKEVAMSFEPSVHYQLNSTDADQEWAALFPNGGIVSPGGNGSQTYMLSMFHQLRCLDILRRTYANAEEPSALTAHCFNYLRQMVLCRRSLWMEAVIALDGPHSVGLWNHMRCLDWRQVYAAAGVQGD